MVPPRPHPHPLVLIYWRASARLLVFCAPRAGFVSWPVLAISACLAYFVTDVDTDGANAAQKRDTASNLFDEVLPSNEMGPCAAPDAPSRGLRVRLGSLVMSGCGYLFGRVVEKVVLELF